MRPNRRDVEQMTTALMTAVQSTERARRKGGAGRLALLYAIAARPESSPKAISEALGFHPSSITRQIQALEADGHVKVTAHPADRRSCRVHLTARGRAEIARLQEIGLRRFAGFVAEWDADEVRTLTRLLWKLEQSKKQIDASAKPAGGRWRQPKKKQDGRQAQRREER